MKAGFCTNVFKSDEMEYAIRRLAELGYDGLEFWQQYLDNVDIKWLKDLMDELKLETAQVCPYFNFTGTEEEWKESINLAKRYIGIALTLNCKRIRIFTGHIAGSSATDIQWEMGIKGVRELCDLGLEHNLDFILEMHYDSLMDTSDNALRLIEGVDRPNLKINLQVPIDGEDIFYSAQKLGKYTAHLHAHNWITRDGKINYTFLDSGEIDFERFIKTLQEEGFDGYISIEHALHHPVWETAEHEIRYLKNIIGRLSGYS